MSQQPSQRSKVGKLTFGTIRQLERSYLAREGSGLQAVAELRRADPGDVLGSPRTWRYLFDAVETSDNSADVTASERAVHAALTLWARHQQSRPSSVDASGVSLGRAAGRLSVGLKSDTEPVDAGVQRRFTTVVTATSFAARVRAIAQLISLFKAHGVALDYARLAEDLYSTQYPDAARRVHLRWARDFHRKEASASPDAKTPTTDVALDATNQE